VGVKTTDTGADFPTARLKEPPEEMLKTDGLLLVTVPVRGPAPFFPPFLMVKDFLVPATPIPVAAAVNDDGALITAPFGIGVAVAVTVGVGVGVDVGVGVTVRVAVAVGVVVVVGVGVRVAVAVAVVVAVGVEVAVGVTVGVGVIVGVTATTPRPYTPRPCVPAKRVPDAFCSKS